MPKGVIGKVLVDPQMIPDWQRHEIPAIPPDHDPDEQPGQCYFINHDYIPFLVALLDYYAWPDAFSGDESERQLAASRFVYLQILLMMSSSQCLEDNDMYLLRQSPANPCVLEQSIDGGATWTTAFDYGRCFARQRTFTEPELQDIIVNTEVDVQTLVTAYQGNPLNVFTDGQFDQGPDDAFRNGGMCYALNLLIIDLSHMAADRMDNGTDWWDVARLVASAVKITGEVILAFAGSALLSSKPEWFYATAIAVGISNWAIGFIDSHDREPDLAPLLNSDVQQALICCAMDVLQGNTPSIGLFSSMFTGCSIPDMNADTLELLEYLTEIEDVYLSFLQMCQTSFEALSGGQSFECGCGDEFLGFDFTAESGSEPGVLYGQQNWVVAGNNPGCGVYSTGIGWVQGNETGGDFTKHRGVGIYHPISGTVSRVKIKFDVSLSNYIDGGNPGAIYYGGDQRLFSIVEVGNGNDRWIERVASRVLTSDNLLCELYCYIHGTSNPEWAGTVTIKRIEVYGTNLAAS